MEEVRKYIFIFFSIALLFPSAVSLSHIFAHEKQEICSDYSDTHYHEETLDCELCDLHAGSFFGFIPVNFNLFSPSTTFVKYFDHYHFLGQFQSLHFELRGPPAVITA